MTDSTLALEVATALLPEKSEKNPFFVESGRALLAGVMTSFILSGAEWNLLDAVIAMRTAECMKSVLERHEETRHLIAKYFEPEDCFKNIMATISNQMALYEPVAHLWAKAEAGGKSVSIKEWLEGEFILVLANDDSMRVPIDAMNRAVFGRIAQLLLRPDKPTGERTLLFLDELSEAGELPGLRRLLNKGLSEGATVIGGFQDIEGLREAYDDETANAILAAFSNKAIFRLESGDTAEWAAKTVGEFESFEYPVSDTSEGKSNTREELVKRESIIPSQVLSIPPTNTTNGLTGYYLSPAIGAYRATLPWSFIGDKLIDPNADVPKFVKRDNIPFVAAWSESDLERLHFKLSLIQGGLASKETRQERNGEKDDATDKPEVRVLKRRGARRQSGN